MLLSKLRRSLPGSTWENETFEGLDLRHALMAVATFNKCTFRDTNLARADMSNSTFIGCTFDHCDMTQAVMIGRFYECVFIDCDLDDAVLRGADIRGTWFKGGRAEYTDFTRASMFNGGFKHVNMHGARLEFAQTDKVDFSGSNLWGAVVPISCSLMVGNTFDARQIHSLFALLLHSHWDHSAAAANWIYPKYKQMINRIVRSQNEERQETKHGNVIEAGSMFSGGPAPTVAPEGPEIRDKSDFPGKGNIEEAGH